MIYIRLGSCKMYRWYTAILAEKNSGSYPKRGVLQEHMNQDHITYPTDSAKNFSKRRANGNRSIIKILNNQTSIFNWNWKSEYSREGKILREEIPAHDIK